MVVFASSSLLSSALSLAKTNAAAKQLTAKGIKIKSATNAIDSTIISPKLLVNEFPTGMCKVKV